MPVNTSRMADERLSLTTYGVSDLTAIYCLREHADNAWVIDRLRMMAEHNEPLPKVPVTDFGSEPDVARTVRDSADLVSFPRSGTVKQSLYLSGCVAIAALQARRDEQRLTLFRRRDQGVDRTP